MKYGKSQLGYVTSAELVELLRSLNYDLHLPHIRELLILTAANRYYCFTFLNSFLITFIISFFYLHCLFFFNFLSFSSLYKVSSIFSYTLFFSILFSSLSLCYHLYFFSFLLLLSSIICHYFCISVLLILLFISSFIVSFIYKITL